MKDGIVHPIPIGELWQENSVVQSFVATQDSLSSISVLLGTYARENNVELLFSLYSLHDDQNECLDDSQQIWRKSIDSEFIEDCDWHELYFPEIEKPRGKSFALKVQCEQGEPGHRGVTPFLVAKDPSSALGWARVGKRPLPDNRAIAMMPRYSPAKANRCAPIRLLYSPITACNLNCIHCISAGTRRKFSRIPETAKEEIAELCRSGQLVSIGADYSGDILFAQSRYGGELDYLISLDIDYEIDTHGNNMSESLANTLLDSRLKRINFSLDAGKQETYSKIRRGAIPFENVVGNIECFMRARQLRGAFHIPVVLSLVLMKENAGDVPLILELAARLDVAAVYINHLQVYDERLSDQSFFHYQEEYNELRNQALEKATALGVRVLLPPSFLNAREREGHHHCEFPWRSAAVLGDGSVMACCVPGTVVGNLNTDSLTEIWNGPRMQDFRQRVNSDNPPAACRGCPMLRLRQNSSSYLRYLPDHSNS